MKLKERLERIKVVFKDFFTKKGLIFFILFSSSFFLIFPSCSMLTRTRTEQYGEVIANTVKNNTKNKDYLSVLITPKAEKQLPTGFFEANELNGIFRGANFNFASTVNASKQQKITVTEFDDDVNYSILYANVFSNHEYQGHYRHEYFPLELMFRGNHDVDAEDYSFCYISVTQANYLLKIKGLEQNENNYQSLLRNKITINYGDNPFIYSIANIFLEQNTFYEGLISTMGDFIMTYAKHPSGFNKTFNYYFNSKPFQNAFLIERLKTIYDFSEYDININSYNISKTFDENNVISYFYENAPKDLNFLSIVLMILTFSLLASSFVFSFFKKIYFEPPVIFALCLFSLIPHLLFRIIYSLTGYTLFFSDVAAVSFFAMFLISIVCFLLLNRFIKRKECYDENN